VIGTPLAELDKVQANSNAGPRKINPEIGLGSPGRRAAKNTSPYADWFYAFSAPGRRRGNLFRGIWRLGAGGLRVIFMASSLFG
jgi:hypothetical protein